MIDLYYWPTPNGWKISIMLEECGLPYRMRPVNIGAGAQFEPSFLAINPNHRIPAIVDPEPPAAFGSSPLALFESGAILRYLAEKSGKFLPDSARGRAECDAWLYWQVGNLGPMAGQHSHFFNYAPGDNPYAAERYAREYDRCLGVLDLRLKACRFLLGDALSVADFASFPWVLVAKPMGRSLEAFPHLDRWRREMKDRPGVRRGVDLGKELRRQAPPGDVERKRLFEQDAASTRQEAEKRR